MGTVMNIRTRLKALEERIPLERKTTRLILVAVPGELAQLEKSRCFRTMYAPGRLYECVILNGPREGVSDADLERFVQSAPINGGWYPKFEAASGSVA